jgi:hypothetical protein
LPLEVRWCYDGHGNLFFGGKAVTTAVQQLLASFDALPEADKQRAAAEILRRVTPAGEGDLSEAALLEAADELFRALDAEEAGHAQR